MKLMSVVDGKKKYLEEVNDEAFSQKMMGDGIAVVPVSYTHLDVYKRQVLAAYLSIKMVYIHIKISLSLIHI